ncbi:MAG: universal stress protein [Rhodoplanes sp.]|jgi:nucleotide-binding universal stress UspA family protein
MSRKRRSYEAGHKPKFLVIIDDTPECDRAVYYAGRRAARTSGGVIMLRVIETQDSAQQWLGVADIMKAEAQEAADEVLTRFAERVAAVTGLVAERVVREGEPAEEIVKLIEEDEDIVVLILAAGVELEGPGPLVTSLSKTVGSFPVPIGIVPGHLSDEELDALS